MVKKAQNTRFSMSVHMIGTMVLLLAVFGIIVSAIGVVGFTNAFTKEYNTTTYHMADTAATLVNGDHMDQYLAGEETEEYEQTRERLDLYCKKINVSLIYVIQVDRSDYGRFVSIFNHVNNAVDQSSYTEWKLGHRRNTTNEEYRRKYKALYDQKAPYETVYRYNPNDGSHPHITTMVPVKNSAGDVTAILCIQRPIRELNEARQPYLIYIALSTLILAILSSYFAAAYIRKQFVAPIRKVSDEAARFARENTKGESLGDISNLEEIFNLAQSIDTMETDMVNYMENLTAVTAEKERIGAELSLASRIQEDSIPHHFPAFPEREDFDIFASMTPAKEVGGDFYNFLLIDEDHLFIVIGDVSGKGVPAALFMMVTNIVVSNRSSMGGSPAEVMAFVNDGICAHNQSDMFVTLWLGKLEISTGRLVFCNAGHDDAALFGKNGTFELVKTKHDLAVGVMPGIQYKNYEIQLNKGDQLFLYTDGIPEATDRNDNMFTIGSMLQALNRYRGKTPREILTGVHQSVNEFVGDTPQFDDMTMLCLEWKGSPPRAC